MMNSDNCYFASNFNVLHKGLDVKFICKKSQNFAFSEWFSQREFFKEIE